MNKADKMFEKANYVKMHRTNDEVICAYAQIDKEDDNAPAHYIEFYTNKTICCFCSDKDYVVEIGILELKAINQKCEELKWI